MPRKLETGALLSDRTRDAAAPNRLRPIDCEAERRAEANKQAAFRKREI